MSGRHHTRRVDPERAVYLWHQGRTVVEIAAEFGVSHGAITYHLRQAGVMDDPTARPVPHLRPIVERPNGFRAPAAGWEDDAACLDVDSDGRNRFHNSNPGPARAYCRACPVTLECLRTALAAEANSYRFGVWGGLTAKDRAALTPDSDLRAAIAAALGQDVEASA